MSGLPSPTGFTQTTGLSVGLGFSLGYGLAFQGFTSFTPASLFANGEPGVWYDPSDFSTMFQDSAGTTPVTAVEQPVGLLLDKSKGLVASTKGGQMTGVSGSGFDTPNATANQITSDIDIRVKASLVSWTPAAITTFCSRILTGASADDSYEFWINTSGVLQLLTISGTTGTNVASSTSVGFAAGATNWVRVTWQQSTGYVNFFTSSDGVTWTQNGTANRAGTTSATNAGTRFLRFGSRIENNFPLNGTIYRAQIYNGINGTLAVDFNPTLYTGGATFTAATGEVWTITGSNARIVPNGNHASQSTAASRPVLSARVNQLTYSEQFDNAAWTKGALTVSANTTATTDPLGGNTADKLQETATTAEHYVLQGVTVAAAQHTFSVYLKAAERTWATIYFSTGSATPTWFDLAADGTGVPGTVASGFTAASTYVGNGWYRCSITGTSTAATWYAIVNPSLGNGVSVNYAGTLNSGIYIWGADLRVANVGANMPVYQRVGAATYGTSTVAGNPDYDTTGFPLFLAFNGVTGSRWMVSSTITPGTDKAQVFAGVRKLSDADLAVICELSDSVTANAGVFDMRAPDTAGNTSFRFGSKGTVFAAATSTSYTAPSTAVLAGIGDISGDVATLRVNGSQVAQNTADQGTGNYLAYPLYLGARAGTSLYYNGNIYELIVRFGPNLSEATIDQTEVWVGDKTGLNLSYATQQTIFDRFNATVLDRAGATILQRY